MIDDNDDPIGDGLRAVRDRLGHESYKVWLLHPDARGRTPFVAALKDDRAGFGKMVRAVLDDADEAIFAEAE